MGCISKQRIDKNLFEESVVKIRKNIPENYSLCEYYEKNYHIILAESHFNERGGKSITKSRANVCTISNGIIFISKSVNKKYSLSSAVYSCSEMISNVYTHVKERLVDIIEGKYSCAIYDKYSEEVILIRDSFGSKSLYYYLDQNYFIFSSEIKPIVHFLNKIGRITIDEQSVLKYFCFLFIPPPATLFKQIKKLDIANMFSFDIKRWKIKRHICYWDMNKIELNTKLNELEIIRETEHLLDNSVRKYSKAIGSFIPAVMLGGLDSTTVAIYLARIFPQIVSYTMRYTGMKDVRDVAYAAKTAKMLGIINNFLYLNKNNIMDNFDEMMRYSNEPMCNTGILPYYYLAKNIGIKTPYAFNGNGAEMLFNCSDSPTYGQLEPLKKWSKLYGLITKYSSKHDSFYDLLRTPILGDYASQFLFFRTSAISKDLHNILTIDSVDQYRNIFFDAEKKITRFHQDDVQNKILYFDYHHEATNYFLNAGDMAAAAAGVEVITPLADRELVEFMFSVEGKWKINRVGNKYILKKIVAKYLGNDIAFRKSNQIVEYPYGSWIKRELRGMFEKYLFNANEYINTEYVKQIYSDHLKNKVDYTFLLDQIFQFQYHINSYRNW